MNVSPRQLQVFVHAAASGSLRAAAQTLHLTAPAASMALAEMERVLGTALFDREHNRLRLNARGRELLPLAQELLARHAEFARVAGSGDAVPGGELRIGTSNTVGNYLVGDLLGGFVHAYPQVSVRLRVANTEDIARGVIDHQLDVGVVEGPVHHPALEVRHWREDRLVVCVAPTHPLALRKGSGETLVKADFREQDWILREPGSATRTLSEQALAKLPPPRSVLELSQTEAIKQAVAAGLGIACLPQVALGDALAANRLVVLETPFLHLQRMLGVLLRRGRWRATALEAFLCNLGTGAASSGVQWQAPTPPLPFGVCMFPRDARIEGYDPELAKAIADERQRQEDHVELIASENYASPRVLEAQGSVLTNKYAEGYPGKRYYGGCEFVDIAEKLAIERVKQLFGADYANVQPHSGSQANQAVYFALLQPGDTILGMSLAHGGHLTHGAKVNASGKLFNAVQYGVNDQGLIDYDEVEKLALEHKPKMVVAGFSAYSQQIDWARFRAIADKVGAYLFVDMAHVAGLVAAGVYPNPLPHAHVVTSTTHKTLRGPRGGIILAKGSSEELEKKLQSIVFPGIQGGPLMHVIAAKAVAFKEALEPEFKTYQEQVAKNAKAMAETLIARGYKIVSGGTQNHLMLVDMIGKDVSGKDAEAALGKAHITVNKNAVPNDPRSPFVTSGLRLGTPAITTRGYLEADTIDLANWIADVLDAPNDDKVIAAVRDKVTAQCRQFPVYG